MQIDILIVNCSIFCPTPSLSAMVINHFKMRSNIVSYNLGGMGCSAGLLSISLAQELLQASGTCMFTDGQRCKYFLVTLSINSRWIYLSSSVCAVNVFC